MNRYLKSRDAYVIALVSVLGACSEPAHAPIAGAPFWAETTMQESVTAVPPPTWAPLPPGGVSFDVPVQLHSDLLFHTRAGAARRRLVYELLETSSETAPGTVASTLGHAGYKAGKSRAGKDGWFNTSYLKKGEPTLTVTFFPKLVDEVSNPKTQSMIAISWQTKAPVKSK